MKRRLTFLIISYWTKVQYTGSPLFDRNTDNGILEYWRIGIAG